MTFAAAGNNAVPDTDASAVHRKLDNAVELLKTSGYTELAGRLEADLLEEPAE